MSALGRYCCKSPKLGGDNFPAIRRSNRRAPIFVASAALARSLTSLSSGDDVPHICTREPRLQPGEFLTTIAKRVLQQYRSFSAITAVQQERPVHHDKQTYLSRVFNPARDLEIGLALSPYIAPCAAYCGDQATPAA